MPPSITVYSNFDSWKILSGSEFDDVMSSSQSQLVDLFPDWEIVTPLKFATANRILKELQSSELNIDSRIVELAVKVVELFKINKDLQTEEKLIYLDSTLRKITRQELAKVCTSFSPRNSTLNVSKDDLIAEVSSDTKCESEGVSLDSNFLQLTDTSFSGESLVEIKEVYMTFLKDIEKLIGSSSKDSSVFTVTNNPTESIECCLQMIEKLSITSILRQNAEDAIIQQEEGECFKSPKSASNFIEEIRIAREEGRQIDIGDRKVGIDSRIGRRSSMEDAEIASALEVNGAKIEVFGVFDGHSGKDCSSFIENNLQIYLQNALSTRALSDEVAVYKGIEECFERLESDYYQQRSHRGGSTVIAAFIINSFIWVANIGDSRAILIKGDGTIVQASEDAKPEIPKYEQEVVRLGGYVTKRPNHISRVCGSLAIARSMGDGRYISGVSAKPQITRFSLQDFEGGFLILACDGLWDVATTDYVGEVIKTMGKARWSPGAMAGTLVDHAIKDLQTSDNVTVMVVPFSCKKF